MSGRAAADPRAEQCHLTQEKLEKAGLGSFDNCRICQKHGKEVMVGEHPVEEKGGEHAVGSPLFVVVPHLAPAD